MRRIFRRHPALAPWLAGLALMLKLLVPAGFMPVLSGGAVRLEICAGMGAEVPRGGAMAAMPGMAHHGDPARPAKAEPCGFGGLSAPALAAMPILLLALTPAAPAWRPPSRTPSTAAAPQALRPPPRGPPVRL